MKFVDILKYTNPNYSIKENVRVIYVNLGKMISYDERFLFTNDEQLLNSIYNRNIDITKDENPKIICNSVNKVFLELLSKLGIKAKLIYKPAKNKKYYDVALVFWDEDNNKYYTNLAADIQNCKYRSQTKFFGIKENQYIEAQDVIEILPEELRKIDKKINYYKYDYTDMVFNLLIEEMKNTENFKKYLRTIGIKSEEMTPDQILEAKMSYIAKYIKCMDKTIGQNEIKQFYQKVFCKSVFDKNELKKFKAYEYYKEENSKLVILSFVELRLNSGPIYYVYNLEKNEYIKTSEEEIDKLIEGMTERKGKTILKYEEKNNFNKIR